MKRTLLVWWRYGKEHQDRQDCHALRVNSPEMIAAHLDRKIARFRATPDDAWRWWQVSDDLIVERMGPPYSEVMRADTRFYYLVSKGVGVMENCHFDPPYAEWRWYLHLADIYFDATRECWIMKDLFCDILIHRDASCHLVLDLHDLGTALDLGLVSPLETSQILRKTNAVLHDIANGEFPFPEMLRAREACAKLGWD